MGAGLIDGRLAANRSANPDLPVNMWVANLPVRSQQRTEVRRTSYVIFVTLLISHGLRSWLRKSFGVAEHVVYVRDAAQVPRPDVLVYGS